MTDSRIYSKTTSYFTRFSICTLVPHALQFSNGYITLKFLISAAFWQAVLVRGSPLLEGDTYFDLSMKWCGV